jgi:hypothetical protein
MSKKDARSGRPPIGKAYVFRAGNVYTSAGSLIGRISQWKVNTMTSPPRVIIELVTDANGLPFFHPLDVFFGAQGTVEIEHTPSLLGSDISVSPALPIPGVEDKPEVRIKDLHHVEGRPHDEIDALVKDIQGQVDQALGLTMNRELAERFGFQAVEGRATDVDGPTVVDTPQGTRIIEPLSIFDTSRHRPRPALLQGRMNPSEPVGGIRDTVRPEYTDVQRELDSQNTRSLPPGRTEAESSADPEGDLDPD